MGEGLGPKEWISLLAILLTLMGLLFTVIQYLKQKKREFKKTFFEHQLSVYKEAVDTTAQISILERDDEDYKKSVKTFYKLYYGKMCLVEDRNVESRMVQFRLLLDAYENEDLAKHRPAIKMQLENYSLALAHTCRNSTIETWGVQYNMEELFTDYSKRPDLTIEEVNYFIKRLKNN